MPFRAILPPAAVSLGLAAVPLAAQHQPAGWSPWGGPDSPGRLFGGDPHETSPDGDGPLRHDEIWRFLADRFEAVDSNRDDSVTPAELDFTRPTTTGRRGSARRTPTAAGTSRATSCRHSPASSCASTTRTTTACCTAARSGGSTPPRNRRHPRPRPRRRPPPRPARRQDPRRQGRPRRRPRWR